jgi:hypothetical protein
MTLTWKSIDVKYGGGDSAFGINFREAFPDIAKQLSDERGFYVDKKSIVVNGFEYKVKMVHSQKGDFTFIEKRQALGDEKPEVVAHKAVQNGDYEKRQQDIALAHKENIEASKAQTAATNLLAASIAALADHVQRAASKDERLVERLETTIKMLPNFKTASELPKGLSTAG